MNRRYYSRSTGALNAKMASLSVASMARQGAIGVEDIIRNKVNKIRHWKLTSLGRKRPKWGFQFSVMTYNILSQTAVDSHMHLYRNCNQQYLSEEYRISRIMPEILKSEPDVVCLQEVEQYLYDQRIKNVFESNGFGSIFKKRTGSKSDGCAILWRRAKFNLLKHHGIEFKTRGSKLLNRDNVGLIAVLRPRHPRANHTQLHVATTHLIFNPKRGEVKLCQLRLLLAELEKSAFKNITETGRSYHPTILCGDFNTEPHSPLYKFIETGRLDVNGLLSGNMSGQLEGKNKGKKLHISGLLLNRLGIDETGRYQIRYDGNDSTATSSSLASELPNHLTLENVETKADPLRSEHLTAYIELLNVMQQSRSGASSSQTCGIPASDNLSNSGSNVQFEKDGSPSSSSDSDEVHQLFYHDFNFVPTYKYYEREKKLFPVTSMTGNDFNTVDHIFYNVKQKSSHSYVEDKLKLLGSYTLPHEEDLKDIGGLPNAHLGSDHLSLISKFLITFK